MEHHRGHRPPHRRAEWVRGVYPLVNRIGPTATLDRDDTDGFGPENIFVARGHGTGIYRISIVHYGGLPPTTATVAIRVINPVTQREESKVVTFQTAGPDRTLNIYIATVDTRNGQIITLQGDTRRLSDEREFEYLKPARSPGQQ